MSEKHYKHWSEAEKVEVQRLFGQGLTDEEIARAIGRCFHGIRRMRRRLGLRKRRVTQLYQEVLCSRCGGTGKVQRKFSGEEGNAAGWINLPKPPPPTKESMTWKN